MHHLSCDFSFFFFSIRKKKLSPCVFRNRHRLGIPWLRSSFQHVRRRRQLRPPPTNNSLAPRRPGQSRREALRTHGRPAVRSPEHCEPGRPGGSRGARRAQPHDRPQGTPFQDRVGGITRGRACCSIPSRIPRTSSSIAGRVSRYLGAVYYNRLPCAPFSVFGPVDELPCPAVPRGNPPVPPPPMYKSPSGSPVFPPTKMPTPTTPEPTPAPYVGSTPQPINPTAFPTQSPMESLAPIHRSRF